MDFSDNLRRAQPLAALLLASGILLAAGGLAQAAQRGDVGAGRKIAQTWCASCHIVGPTKQAVSNGAPSFSAVADMKSTTWMSLTVFLRTPHFPMPNFQLGNDQIDNVIAYILSLRTRP